MTETQSEYTRTRGAGIYVGKDPSTKFINSNTPTLPLECTVTDYSFTAPEGEEIDVAMLGKKSSGNHITLVIIIHSNYSARMVAQLIGLRV